MKVKILGTLVVLAMLAVTPVGLSARTLGMVADNTTSSVTVFDADTNALLGMVPISSGSTIGDVLITPDQKFGFVTNFHFEVFVIDLTTSPPSLAGGTNPIPISNGGEDLTISPTGKYLVVSDGDLIEPISVIDIAARTEVSTFFPGFDANSLNACTDGSVLATSFNEGTGGTVRRFALSGTGVLTDTGEMFSVDADPVSVYCTPSATSGIVLFRGNLSFLGGVTSFTIPGLSVVDSRSLSGSDGGISGAINAFGHGPGRSSRHQ
jgi:DNA-binding beta-propeller fold protein YncE